MMSIKVLCSLFVLSFFRMGSRRSYLVSCFILFSFLLSGSEACWGKTAPTYGDMTHDYDIEVGSELVLNCTLKNTTFPDLPRPVSSSDLVIEKGYQHFSTFTQKIDDYTVQLKIPRSTEKDTGVYICKIFLSKDYKPVVCGSEVKVGYPPQNVTNFTCISRNFDNLNCSWNTEKNNVNTKYTIVTYKFNFPGLDQRCPNNTERPNSCEWTTKTDPSYESSHRDIGFTVRGNNSLGQSENHFVIDGYAIVIPNKPEKLNPKHIDAKSIVIQWVAPTMRNFAFPLPLKYEVWISKVLYNSSDVIIYDAGNNTLSFTIDNLIPYILYNVSVRCRSIYAEGNNMWSSFATLIVKTLPDVPYETPKVTPEAYELHMYDTSRSASLFWKIVPEMYHNGEKFHYHIKYTQNILSVPSKIHTINSSTPFIEIKNLLQNSSYFFHIHSANGKGISEDFELIYIPPENKIPPRPKDVRVISQGIGHYNLSWNPPNDFDNFSYTVFWCSSLKPWFSHCDSSIQWIEEDLYENNIVLNLTDVNTNYQFAVASKYDADSSGMQWASCILPHKGGLSKIKSVNVEQKNSTTLKVIWYFDCPAVVKRYEITYCRVQRSYNCKVAEVEPYETSFLLNNLHPFSNYSIKIRSINYDNKAGEDSDPVIKATLPGAPSEPPKNVHVYSKGRNTYSVSWIPPTELNGIIKKYIISYNGSKENIEVPADKNEFSFTDDELKPYSFYAVQVQACVHNECSNKSEPAMIRTDVDVPGFMDPPRMEEVNSTHFKVSWATPLFPNGPIDFYVILWHELNATSSYGNMINVTKANSVILDVKCPTLGEERKYLFYVRAVNVKNSSKLFGPLSESSFAKACQMPEGEGMFIGVVVGAAICAVVILVLMYRFAIWMKLKIHQVKSITIRLPEGLEGPETNPLNNYECFKNGLKGNLQTNNNERLSYIIDENKNRHGSGSSQFSNSSAEELIFKNGKCTKFGRKPSGDSSGCSSMSSNVTPRMHLSSDSGNESDFAIPPSPDSANNESNLHNSHKTPLPILMEVHDQSSGEKTPLQQSLLPHEKLLKYKNADDGMILRIDPPYSKFGISSNTSSSLPWRVNPLAFYSCNLSNSEPSVFDTQKPEISDAVIPPYSKVGLAKSSEDIGISSVKQMGYSKFGFPTSEKRFSVPPSNINPIAMVVLENPDRKEWPNIKKFFDNNYTHSKTRKKVDMNVPSNDLEEDCGYIKVGRGNLCPKKPTNGYVPFNDVRSQMDQGPTPVLVNTVDQVMNGHIASAIDKDQVEFHVGPDWSTLNLCEENRNDGSPEVLFNVPCLPNSIDGTILDETLYNSNNFGFKVPYTQNSNEMLPKTPPESEIKYNSDSPTLSFTEMNFENNSFSQDQMNSMPNDNNISYSKENVTVEESCSGRIPNAKTECYAVPNEVIVTPMTLRDGYVPFNALSNPVCNRTPNHLSNIPELSVSQTVFPNGVCAEEDNYITPTHKGDLRLLPKTVPVISAIQRDSLNSTEKYIQNGNGYANLSLKYILKPLPKMESEICEV